MFIDVRVSCRENCRQRGHRKHHPSSCPWAVSDASTPITETSSPIAIRRFDSTKPTELRFSALLTEGDARVRFHREGFGQLKEHLA
jgi:hypothetical protein